MLFFCCSKCATTR